MLFLRLRRGEVKKNGKRNGKQRYLCKKCNRRFDGGNHINNDELWRQYAKEKRTVKQLAQIYSCSEKTIRRHLTLADKKEKYAEHKNVNIIMDTTYFQRKWGVMVLLDSTSGEALSVQIIENETVDLYQQELQKLIDKGINIQSITCDGRRGLLGLLPNIPKQMCQFHQSQIIRRYLTNNPKSIAAQELRQLAYQVKELSEKELKIELDDWLERHQNYVNERSYNEETHRITYLHKRLRSAYLSLNRNIPYLFTYEHFPNLKIPTTTNLLESRFAVLKDHLRCHRGLNTENKIKFIKDFFSV